MLRRGLLQTVWIGSQAFQLVNPTVAAQRGVHTASGVLTSQRGMHAASGVLTSQWGVHAAGGALASQRGMHAASGVLTSQWGVHAAGGALASQRGVHAASGALATMSKDLVGKKHLLRSARQARQEDLGDELMDGVDLAGLTEAGITIPTPETPSMLIEGTRYDELPIAHIKSSLNNTIITITDYKGTDHLARGSCGTEGFRNVKKSTNVAAQATGLAVGFRAIKAGVRYLRVCVQGLGAGRLASMKGLQQAGIQIISITDTTRIPHNGPKSRKARRL